MGRGKVLLIEANNMCKWVGGSRTVAVHLPPIGLMYLAAYARRARPDVKWRILESSLDCPSDREYYDVLGAFEPDVVGIRSIAFFLEELQRIAALTRAAGNALIIAGGPIVQAYGKRLFAEVPELDIAVKGEGEATLARILNGEPIGEIPGVLYRSEGQIVENADAAEIADLDSLPFPAYDLIDLNAYERCLSYTYNHRRQGILLTSRGCVYDCTFCFSHWKTMRLRSASNIYDEICELYHAAAIRDFYIIDDIFNVSPKRALELFSRIVSGGLRLRLYFANGLRADMVSEEFVDRAVEAGAIWFTYAVESADAAIQRLVNKKLNLEKTKRIIAYTQGKGVAVNISTMFGFPTETREQAQHTLDWLGELPKPSLLPYHFCLRVFPGCKIREQALAAGWKPETVEMTSRFSYNDLPVSTPTLSRSDMIGLLLQYHARFGLSNSAATAESVRTLRAVGYRDEEIVQMYSVLKRKPLDDIGEIACGLAAAADPA